LKQPIVEDKQNPENDQDENRVAPEVDLKHDPEKSGHNPRRIRQWAVVGSDRVKQNGHEYNNNRPEFGAVLPPSDNLFYL
jgi:hypothetical protein